jgi:tetratricopeptide (TPR) repeat protein
VQKTENAQPRWRPVLEDSFEKQDSEEWYKSSKGWLRNEFTINGKTPLTLPIKSDPYSMLQFSASTSGRDIIYNAGYSPEDEEGIRVIFKFAKNITPDSITGVEIYRNDILIARNYRIKLSPGVFNTYQIMIEDSSISVKVNRDKLLFFDGIIPFKTTKMPFTLDPAGAKLEISSISLFSKKFPARTISGDDFFRDRSYDKALDLYLKTVDDYRGQPISREALFKAGLCYELLAEYKKALDVYVQFTREDGVFYPRAQSHIWLCYISLNDFENADIQYNRFREDYTLFEMLSQVPFSTLYTIFEYYQDEAAKKKTFKDAISLYEKAVDTANFLGLYNEGYDTINQIGELYRAAGDFDKAISIFRRAQGEYPDLISKSAWNQMRIGEVYRLMGDIPAAMKEYGKVIQRYPGEESQKAWASLWLAEMALAQGNREKAEHICYSAKLPAGLPVAASQVLLQNAEISEFNTIPAYFKNDLLYFKAVASLSEGRKDQAYDLLKNALLVGRKNDWPEALIKKKLAEMESKSKPEVGPIF